MDIVVTFRDTAFTNNYTFRDNAFTVFTNNSKNLELKELYRENITYIITFKYLSHHFKNKAAAWK